MGRKLKLDLHTHCFEALGFVTPSESSVGRIVAKIREKGLDGIAITEHYSSFYGVKAKEIAAQHFPDVLIIPGQEVDVGPHQEVELFLPDGKVFRFLAHPGYPGESDHVDGIQGIEVDNFLHRFHLNKNKILALAEKHGLLMLSNSDAHDLGSIGACYNEIALEELSSRATAPGPET